MIEFVDHKTNEQIHLINYESEYRHLPRVDDEVFFLHESGKYQNCIVTRVEHIICNGEQGWPLIYVRPRKKSIIHFSLSIFNLQLSVNI